MLESWKMSINEDFHQCSNFIGHYVDVMTGGFTGVAGFYMWDGFMHPTPTDPVDEEILWPSTIRAQQHMNGDDVINTLQNGKGNWVQGRQQEKLNPGNNNQVAVKELQYYVSNNKEIVVGYIKNRSYNISTKRTSSLCFMSLGNPIDNLIDISYTDGPNSNTLWIEDLKKNTDYRIDWYTFKEGFYLGSECLNTNGKKLKLKHPVLLTTYFDRPIVWFVVQQENCNKSMEIEGDSNDPLDFEEIEDLDVNSNLKIFPNPFKELFNIESPVEDSIIIFTTEGKKIHEQLIHIGLNRFENIKLTRGVYFIQFNSLGIQKKLIVL